MQARRLRSQEPHLNLIIIMSSDTHELFSFEELGKAFARAMEGHAPPAQETEDTEILDIPDEFMGDDFSVFSPEEETTPEQQIQPFGPTVEDDGIVPVSPLSVLEAMLFMGDPQNRPLAPALAAELMRGVTVDEIHALVRELNVKYDAQRAPWTVVLRDGGYVMQLREEFLPIRELFYGTIRQAKLSQAAIDILAIIAYKQPLTAEEVTQLRGTASITILGQLVRRQLLRTKRVKRDGKTITEYYTTDRFLELFSLESLGDLPRSEDLDRK